MKKILLLLLLAACSKTPQTVVPTYTAPVVNNGTDYISFTLNGIGYYFDSAIYYSRNSARTSFTAYGRKKTTGNKYAAFQFNEIEQVTSLPYTFKVKGDNPNLLIYAYLNLYGYILSPNSTYNHLSGATMDSTYPFTITLTALTASHIAGTFVGKLKEDTKYKYQTVNGTFNFGK